MKAANERRFDNFKNKILNEASHQQQENIYTKPIGNINHNDTMQNSNSNYELFRELEKSKHEYQLQKVKHEYELAFREMHDKTMLLSKKMDELEQDQDEPAVLRPAAHPARWRGRRDRDECQVQLHP